MCQSWHGDIPSNTEMTRWLFFKYFLKCLSYELFHRRNSEKVMEDFLDSEEGKKLISELTTSIKNKKKKFDLVCSFYNSLI